MVLFKKSLVILAVFGTIYLKKGFFMYGLVYRGQLKKDVNAVVDCLGGGEDAVNLLLETASAETNLGETVDTTWNSGIGIMQFDPLSFVDLQNRISKSTLLKIKNCFDVDFKKLVVGDLRYSVFLSVLSARLKYMLIPQPIPNNLLLRAEYWKRYYNSVLGKGSALHYVENARGNQIA